MKSALVTICFVMAFPLSHGMKLVASPKVIDPDVTTNVHLDCINDDATTNDIVDITRIRILKQDGDHWRTFAEVINFAQVTHSEPGIIATGTIGTMNDTFLRITWPKATDATAGQYRCDVIGFKSNLDVAMIKTPIAVIVKHNVTAQEVLDIVDKLKLEFHKDLEEQRKDMEEKLTSLTQTVDFLTNQLNNVSQAQTDLLNHIDSVMTTLESKLLDQLQHSLTNVSSDLLEKLQNVNETLQELLNEGLSIPVNIDWPQGDFGLLQTQSGCPSDVSNMIQWSTGYIRLHSESSQGANQDNVSSGSHFAAPVLSTEGNNNFVYQRFCTTQDNKGSQEWPSGSYCINRVNGDCPAGFGSGYLKYDEEDENYSGKTYEGHADSTLDAGRNIYYCCRGDGSFDQAIQLPPSSPFYLYRYGGKCQQVQGMTVSEEYMIVDTENSVNRDAYQNSNHPDGALNDVMVQLCYYY